MVKTGRVRYSAHHGRRARRRLGLLRGGGRELVASHPERELAFASSDRRVPRYKILRHQHTPEIDQNASATLRAKIAAQVIRGGMVAKAKSALRAREAAVRSVHILDGRTLHSVTAELVTDRGVGTLVTRR